VDPGLCEPLIPMLKMLHGLNGDDRKISPENLENVDFPFRLANQGLFDWEAQFIAVYGNCQY